MNPGLSQTFYFDSAQFEIENTKHICFVLIEAEYKRYSKNRKENLKKRIKTVYDICIYISPLKEKYV